MHKIYLLFLTAIFFIGCQIDKKAKKQFTKNDDLLPKYLVSQINIINKNGEEEIMKLKYDSLNRRIEIQEKNLITYYAYDKSNNLASIKKVSSYRSSTIVAFDTLIYNKKSIEMISTTKGIEPIHQFLEINHLGQIIKMNMNEYGSYTYLYDKNSNLMTRSYQNKSECTNTKFQYDNKYSPYIDAKKNQLLGYDKNNVLKQITYNCKNDSIIDIMTYTYKYNDYGYPIEQKIKKGDTETISTFKYILKK